MPLVTRASNQGNFYKQATTPTWLDGDIWSDTTTDALRINVAGVDTAIGKSTFSNAAVVSQNTTSGDYTTPTAATVSSTSTEEITGDFIETYAANTGWTQVGTTATVNSGVAGKFAAVNLDLDTNDRVHKSLGTTLGNTWIAYFEFNVTAMTSNGTAVIISMQDLSAGIIAGDAIILMWKDSTGQGGVRVETKNNAAEDLNGTKLNLSYSTLYYATLIRDSATSVTFKIHSNAARTTLVGGTSAAVISSNVTGLAYVAHGAATFGPASAFASYTVDNLTIWNNTVTNTAHPSSNLFDTDVAKRWTSASEATPNAYLDNTSSLNICAIAIYPDLTNTTATEFKIQSSTDASTWTTKRTVLVSSLTGGAYNFYRMNILKGRYLRLLVSLPASASVLSIFELKTFTQTDTQILSDLGILEISSSSTALNAAGV